MSEALIFAIAGFGFLAVWVVMLYRGPYTSRRLLQNFQAIEKFQAEQLWLDDLHDKRLRDLERQVAELERITVFIANHNSRDN